MSDRIRQNYIETQKKRKTIGKLGETHMENTVKYHKKILEEGNKEKHE